MVLLLNVFAGIRIDLRKLDVVLPVFAVVGAPSLKMVMRFCLAFSAVCVAVLIGLFASEVLSTFDRPTADLSSVWNVLSPR